MANSSTAIEIVTFGESQAADVRVLRCRLRRTGSSFELRTAEEGGPVTLSVPATTTSGMPRPAMPSARRLGVPDEVIRVQLARYRGTYRRFQLVGTVDAIRVYDDYAHHPTEVANTLAAARTSVGDGRVVVCFQPHLYTRTRDFWRELAAALERADQAIVMDVCGDREDPIPGWMDGWWPTLWHRERRK